MTSGSLPEAKKIAKALLEKRLIACGNIVPEIVSIYWWKGKIQEQTECLLLAKTIKKLIPKVIAEVEKIHSYEVPCIEFIKINAQNKEFRQWAEKELSR